MAVIVAGVAWWSPAPAGAVARYIAVHNPRHRTEEPAVAVEMSPPVDRAGEGAHAAGSRAGDYPWTRADESPKPGETRADLGATKLEPAARAARAAQGRRPRAT